MKFLISILFISFLFISCVIPPQLGIDPKLTWEAPTTNCDGTVLVGSVRYNIYAVLAPGPIPTAPTPNEVPCGILQLASIQPLNPTPISGAAYEAILPAGTWIIAIEAVGSSGSRSELSNSVSAIVQDHPDKVTGLVVAFNEDGTIAIKSM